MIATRTWTCEACGGKIMPGESFKILGGLFYHSPHVTGDLFEGSKFEIPSKPMQSVVTRPDKIQKPITDLPLFAGPEPEQMELQL